MNVIKRLIGLCVMMLILTCCKNENLIDLPVLSKDMVVNENYIIPAACKDPITYTSSNEYAVQVSETGKVTARHYTGKETEVLLTSEDDSKSFIVNVTPRSTLYIDPDISIGQLRSTLTINPNWLVYSENNIDCYTYGGNAPYLLISYTSANRVDYYAVLVYPYLKYELATFLAERYEQIGTEDGISYYRDALTPEAAKIMIAVYDYSYEGIEYRIALYTRYPSGKDDTSLFRQYIDKQLELVLEQRNNNEQNINYLNNINEKYGK